jgi:hypothetical protein
MDSPPSSPLRFSPAVENPRADEADTHAQLVETLLRISTTTYADGHKALRAVHAKSHGLLKGKLVVRDLPPMLAQGLFARAGDYGMKMMPAAPIAGFLSLGYEKAEKHGEAGNAHRDRHQAGQNSHARLPWRLRAGPGFCI